MFALFAISGCTQRETGIGGDAVTNQPEQTFEVVEGTATKSAVWHPKVTTGRGASLQVGDTAFTAIFLAQFDPLEALPDSYTVDSMVYVMRRNRVWPEADAIPLEVRVRQVRQDWTEDSLFIGSFAVRDTLPILGTLTMGIAPTDTIYPFTIPPPVWQEWIDIDSLNNGLLFEPVNYGTMIDLYSSEAAAGYQSKLSIYIVEHRTDASDTAYTLEMLPDKDAYVATDHAQNRAPERLVISQGYPQRAALYFPLDSISSVYDRQVNRAQLFIHADQSDPENFLYTGQNLSYKDGTLADTLWFDNPDSTHLDLVAIEAAIFDSTNTIIAFNVTSSVASWIAHPERNAGFQIQTSLESGYLARHVFYGTGETVPAEKLPRLVIWYTESSQ
ncbi:hypothetical protein HZB60_06060 [candidate division KSB1 bacterium]|nr:hypothetical protein [candidate division KSB1 bacterium]